MIAATVNSLAARVHLKRATKPTNDRFPFDVENSLRLHHRNLADIDPPTHPSLPKLKCAFRLCSGSKVQLIRSIPCAMTCSRCASLRRRPRSIISICRLHSQHVRMMGQLTALETRKPINKPHQRLTIKSANQHTTRFFRSHQMRERHDVEIRNTPDFLLQLFNSPHLRGLVRFRGS